eukprot:CAMPEP_0194523522 /NCGR_PEP_ID=MMETSP0253-20130528/58426_1 /TAXON_ID=2966 /ORGANISM="Noctiluca scintillans" /LENGTH=200 /DNA_ID=CAMNT_0039368067 /DNA_START=127 /DNA_END=729 /DNA_ORIENTATION=+
MSVPEESSALQASTNAHLADSIFLQTKTKLRRYAESLLANNWHASAMQQAATDSIHEHLRASLVIPTTNRQKEILVIFELLGLGFLGIDRMYIGGARGITLGVVKLLTVGGCGLWAAFDFMAVMINAVQRETTMDFLGMKAEFEHSGLEAARALGIAGLVAVVLLVSLWLGTLFSMGFAAARASQPLRNVDGKVVKPAAR